MAANETRLSGIAGPIASTSLTEASAEDTDLQAEVAGILNDAAMPIAEKQQRLQELADRYGVAVLGASADLDGDGEVSPLELQLAEAFGMLAVGGHSYRDEEGREAEEEAAGGGGT
jgi:hypothetical protein